MYILLCCRTPLFYKHNYRTVMPSEICSLVLTGFENDATQESVVDGISLEDRSLRGESEVDGEYFQPELPHEHETPGEVSAVGAAADTDDDWGGFNRVHAEADHRSLASWGEAGAARPICGS